MDGSHCRLVHGEFHDPASKQFIHYQHFGTCAVVVDYSESTSLFKCKRIQPIVSFPLFKDASLLSTFGYGDRRSANNGTRRLRDNTQSRQNDGAWLRSCRAEHRVPRDSLIITEYPISTTLAASKILMFPSFLPSQCQYATRLFLFLFTTD